jgi:transposase
MEIVYAHCAGLDVHKKTVVVAIIVPDEAGGLRKEVRTFGTMTADLLALSDWLMTCGVTHVAMESTGEYWKPVYNILENNFEILLVNAQHIKAVPGRKTDVKDAEWIAEIAPPRPAQGQLCATAGAARTARVDPLSQYFCAHAGDVGQSGA